MATSKAEFLAGLNDKDENVRFGTLATAEEEARRGSPDAKYALAYALGDSESVIKETAKDVFEVLLREGKVTTFELSYIKGCIGKEVDGKRREVILNLLDEIVGQATMETLDWKTARKISAINERDSRNLTPAKNNIDKRTAISR